jgi:hypothetical protein
MIDISELVAKARALLRGLDNATHRREIAAKLLRAASDPVVS